MRSGNPTPSGPTRALAASLLLALALLPATTAHGQLNPRTIGELGPRDLFKNEQQRELVHALARRHLGTMLHGQRVQELDALQRLLDERHVGRDEVYTQQALGVVLGDILVATLALHWVSVDDDLGHARALRYRDHEDIFFPVTMISKRIQTGEPVDVRALYDLVETRVRALEKRS